MSPVAPVAGRRCLTKKELRKIFGDGETPITPYRLRVHFFPDDLLKKLSLTRKGYAKIKTFPAHMTRIIVNYHQIIKDDLDLLDEEK